MMIVGFCLEQTGFCHSAEAGAGLKLQAQEASYLCLLSNWASRLIPPAQPFTH